MKNKAANFRASDYARVRLADAEVIRLTGCSRTTAAHWRTGKHPPPPAALALVSMRYTGDLSGVFGRSWHGFRIALDGLFYIPGFKYGFAPGELAQWFRLVCQRDEFAHALERLKTALQDAQARADYWRMLATLKTSPAPAFALSMQHNPVTSP